MKPVLITIVTLLLSACSNKITTSYYQLNIPVWQNRSSTLSVAHQPQVIIEPVMVSDFLAGNGIVMQTSPVRYIIANHHLWGSPLDQQLQQSLLVNLKHRLPNWLVTTQNFGEKPATLAILVTDFQGGQDGNVFIKGIWTYERDEKLLQQPFYRQLKQKQAGYEGLVQTLSSGWTDLADEIATIMNKESPQPLLSSVSLNRSD